MYHSVNKHCIKAEDIPSWSVFLVDGRILNDVEKKGENMIGHYYYEGDDLIGFTIVTKFNDKLDIYILEYIETNPSFLRKGIGSYMFNEMKTIYKEFVIESVPDTIIFHLENGAKPLTTFSGGYLLVVSERSPLVIKNEMGFGEGFQDPDENFVYSREEWEKYTEQWNNI